MKTKRESQQHERAPKIKSRHRQEIAEPRDRQCRGIQQQAHIVGERHQQAANHADAHHQEIKPARRFGGIADGFRTVHRGNRFRQHGIEKIRSAEAAKPQPVRTVEVRAHQIGAAQFRAEEVGVL